MQDRLREIEGTLARSKERKNTILYKLSKRRQEEERLAKLGVERLPTNPREVDDEKVIKYVLFRLKQEIGDKTAQLRDPKLLSIDKDGEGVIRAKNDEVNKLLSRKCQWEARLSFLAGEPTLPRLRKKTFFGCAKELPEALVTRKRQRVEGEQEVGENEVANSSDEDELIADQAETEQPATRDQDYLEGVAWLGTSAADLELARFERESEAKMRTKGNVTAPRPGTSDLILSYCKDGKLMIPDEEHFKRKLVNNRKKALQERLTALRNKS
ncbi:Isy1-like splicing family, putative [Leishmania lindenbergi]|uniref:Isy1-like splicing family n=1 Tax=Leishmania lindenbergi TaxID=651832 RepID=A0AAW3AX46_9TRYP